MASAGLLTENRLLRIQAASGLAFATFLVLHLVNTGLASAGQGTYDGFQRAARNYYQLPPVEIAIVLLAPMAHAFASVIRIARRRRAKAVGAPELRVRLHRLSGYYLLLVLMGHVVATRAPAFVASAPADFSFLNFSLTYWPWFFYPYYLMFALCGLYHLTNGTIIAVRVFGVRVPASLTASRSRPVVGFVGLGGALLVAGVLALGGVFGRVDRGRFEEWRELYDRVAPAAFRPWSR